VDGRRAACIRDGRFTLARRVVRKLPHEAASIRLRNDAALHVVSVLEQRIAVGQRNLRYVVVGIVGIRRDASQRISGSRKIIGTIVREYLGPANGVGNSGNSPVRVIGERERATSRSCNCCEIATPVVGQLRGVSVLVLDVREGTARGKAVLGLAFSGQRKSPI
jgi:hypothetical protein